MPAKAIEINPILVAEIRIPYMETTKKKYPFLFLNFIKYVESRKDKDTKKPKEEASEANPFTNGFECPRNKFRLKLSWRNARNTEIVLPERNKTKTVVLFFIFFK
jgi:hypothetical protein